MTISVQALGVRSPRAGSHDELLLRETMHRWCNDLQLIVGLLAHQGRRAANPEVQRALAEATERVSVFSRARRAMCREHQPSLTTALDRVCEALRTQAEPRSIAISLSASEEVLGLSDQDITTLTLVVNELATNAIKHAFKDGRAGRIRIKIARPRAREVLITVEDDGCPFDVPIDGGAGLGVRLSKELMAWIGGDLTLPRPGTKRFELRLPDR